MYISNVKPLLFIFILILTFLFSCKKEEVVDVSYSDLGQVSTHRIHSIHIASNGHWYIAAGKTDNGEIKKSVDQGQTWTQVLHSDKELYDVEMVSATRGYACGQDMSLYLTQNSGASWQPYVFPFLPVEHEIVHFKDIFFIDSLNGIICGGENYNNGSLIRFKGGGFQWAFTHFDRELGAVWMHNPATSVIGGYGGFYTSNDSANTFSICNFSGDNFNSVYFTDSNTGYACGYDGGIYSTSDGGTTWKTILKKNRGISARKHFNAIVFTNAATGFVAGNDGCMLRTTDGGQTWVELSKPAEEHLLSLTYSPALTKVILAGANGHVYTFTP